MHKDTLEVLNQLNIIEGREGTLSFIVPKFFTSNMMYDFVSAKGTNKVHVVLNNNVREMKADIVRQLENNSYKGKLIDVKAFSVHVIMYSAWLTKSRHLKKIDLTNIYKPIEDAIMDAIELDDSLCVDERLSKAVNEEYPSGTLEVNFKFFR